MKEVKLRNSTVEKLENEKRSGEPLFKTADRLLGDGDGDGGDGVTTERLAPEQRDAAEQLAAKVLIADDIAKIADEGVSRREFLAEEFGIDPAKYDDEYELLADVREARG